MITVMMMSMMMMMMMIPASHPSSGQSDGPFDEEKYETAVLEIEMFSVQMILCLKVAPKWRALNPGT